MEPKFTEGARNTDLYQYVLIHTNWKAQDCVLVNQNALRIADLPFSGVRVEVTRCGDARLEAMQEEGESVQSAQEAWLLAFTIWL